MNYFQLDIVFFSENFQYFATSPLPALGCYFGCTENGQPIGVTVHSDLRSDELMILHAGDGLQLKLQKQF